MGRHSLLQGIFPTQGSNPDLLHYRQIFLPAEPPGKPKNIRVGSLSLLQRIFLTQELNRGSPEYSREGNKTVLSNGTHGLSVLIHCSYEMSYTDFSLLPTAICLCLKTLHSCCGALFSMVQTSWQLGHVHRTSEPQSKADEVWGPFQSQSHHLVSFCAK